MHAMYSSHSAMRPKQSPNWLELIIGLADCGDGLRFARK